MRTALKRIGSVLAFIAAFAVVRGGISWYQEYSASQKASATVTDMMNDAAKKHPGSTVSQATINEAIERSKNTLTSEADATKRQRTAAEQFYGFYFINTRARPEFCLQQGVDISPFTKAFENEHVEQLARARAVAKLGTSEDDFYGMMREAIWKVLSQDMQDIATANATSLKGSCELISQQGPEVAAKLNIANVNPTLLRALMND
jgi:hypothetical protein